MSRMSKFWGPTPVNDPLLQRGTGEDWPEGSVGREVHDRMNGRGTESLPVKVTHNAKKDNATIDRMAGRIVKTYLAADPKAQELGEKFYSHDANGAARNLANGWSYDSPISKFERTTPAYESRGKGTTNPEWGQSHAAPTYSPLAEQHKQKMHQAAGVLARLSPQTEWETNVKQAHEAYNLDDHTLSFLRSNARDTTRKPDKNGEYPRMEVRDKAGNKLELNKQPTSAILKAHEIARGYEPPEKYVASDPESRVKIGSFQHNIEHPQTSPYTTVDFRAHDIASGKLYSTGTNREMSKSGKPPAPGKAPSKAYTQKKRYDMIEEAHNRAADIINTQHSDRSLQSAPLQPKQVQAVTWWADKNYQDEKLGGVAKGGHLHAGEGGKTLRREDLGRPVGQ